jgi:exosome complex component RRP46
MALPESQLSPLNRADGSAQYSANGYTVVGAINGPIEVGRRDELAEEATLEINVRPDVGVGSTMKTIFFSVALL